MNDIKNSVESEINGLSEFRKQALDNFNLYGLPNSKDERWKYTDISKSFLNIENYKKDEFEENFDVQVLNNSTEIEFGKILDLQNFPHLESKVGSIFGLDYNGFTTLNLASFNSGYYLNVPKNVKNASILINTNLRNNSFSLNNIRNIINVEEGGELNIIEVFRNHEISNEINNIVTEVFASKQAKINYTRIFNLDTNSTNQDNKHIHTLGILQESDSIVSTYTFMINGNLLRNEIYQHLKEERAEGNLYGLYVSSKNQHFDTFTFVDHHAANCNSNELYKGLLKDESVSIFNGKILVREDAQKTNAYQSSKNILLSKDARVNAKPQLEIFADDVKCSHGATTGQFDENALFYLMARGIDKIKAQNMLSFAYLNEVIEICPDEIAKELIINMINEKFSIKEFI